MPDFIVKYQEFKKLVTILIITLIITALYFLVRKYLSELWNKVKLHRKDAWIWLIEYITVYLLPFFIFAVVFQLTEDEISNWDKLISLPNWMLIGIILFGESLKELIEYLWKAQGRFKENVKFSLSIGLFGISMCAVFLAILIFDQYHSKENSHLIKSFYYWQVALFLGSTIYSFLMKILIADATTNSNSMEEPNNINIR